MYILFISELVYKFIYILFINLVGYLDIFCSQLSWNINLYINVYLSTQVTSIIYCFLLKLIIIVRKKIVQPMGSTRPNPTQLGWVGLDLCDGLDWVEFFLTHHGGLGKKIPSTRPMHTPTYTISLQVYLFQNHLIVFTSRENC